MTTLVVTNDFPPRIGGIESFVALACRLLDDDVAVLTSTAPGSAYGDVAAGYPIERLPGPLLPTPAVGRAAVDLLHRSGADRVLFGAAAPLALLAPTLRAAGADRIVALTHGHETWWATVPGSRSPAPPDRRRGGRADHDLRLRDGADRVRAQPCRSREAGPAGPAGGPGRLPTASAAGDFWSKNLNSRR